MGRVQRKWGCGEDDMDEGGTRFSTSQEQTRSQQSCAVAIAKCNSYQMKVPFAMNVAEDTCVTCSQATATQELLHKHSESIHFASKAAATSDLNLRASSKK